MIDIKPCPFCGGFATLATKHLSQKNMRMVVDVYKTVEFKVCDAHMGGETRRFRTNEDAIKAWNERALQ